jgi:hypothetical protein
MSRNETPQSFGPVFKRRKTRTSARTSGTGIRGRVEEIFNEDNPARGYEVLSEPPLGKCSINLPRRKTRPCFRILQSFTVHKLVEKYQ